MWNLIPSENLPVSNLKRRGVISNERLTRMARMPTSDRRHLSHLRNRSYLIEGVQPYATTNLGPPQSRCSRTHVKNTVIGKTKIPARAASDASTETAMERNKESPRACRTAMMVVGIDQISEIANIYPPRTGTGESIKSKFGALEKANVRKKPGNFARDVAGFIQKWAIPKSATAKTKKNARSNSKCFTPRSG